MENQYVSYGKNQYLRIPAEEGMESSFELSMLHAAAPKNLLPVQYVREKEGNFLDYCVTGLVSLEESQDDEEMETYFQSLIFALERLGNTLDVYLLSERQILLEPSKIFLRKEMGEFLFTYSPGSSKTVQENLTGLMEFFLKKLNPMEEKDVLLTYGIYQKAREPHVTLKSLAEFYRGKAESVLPSGKNPARRTKEREENDAGDKNLNAAIQDFREEYQKSLTEEPLPQKEKGKDSMGNFAEETRKLSDPLYRNFGIERPKENDGFTLWKNQNSVNERMTFEGEEESRYVSEKSDFENTNDSMEGIYHSKGYHKDEPETPEFDETVEKENPIALFIKKHLFEVGVIGTVIAGMIVVLLT